MNPNWWTDRVLWLLLAALTIGAGFGIYHFSGGYAKGEGGHVLATCTGADPCKACKTCRYCKHCAKDGGTCGVNKKATSRAAK